MALLNSLFAWVVAASLRASLLAIVVIALQSVMNRRLSARCRYALWLPMILVVVIPVLPTSPWSLENRFTSLQTALPPASLLGPFHARLAETIVFWSAVAPTVSGSSFVAGGWLFVTVTLMAVAAISYRRTLRRIRRGGAMVGPELWSNIVAEAQRIRLRRLPRVIVSEAVESPAVTGLFRSVLLLPADFPTGLKRTETSLILLHELTHLRRLDLLLNWFLCVLQALHWFNPLLWLAFRRLRADREAACDAQVLSAHKTDVRAEYAHAVLKLHQAASVSDLSLAFGGHHAPTTLRGRLLSITRHGQVHPVWSAVGVVMVAGLILTGATRAPSNEGLASDTGTKGRGGHGGGSSLVTNAPNNSLPLIGSSAPGAGTPAARRSFTGRMGPIWTDVLSDQRSHRPYGPEYILETLFHQAISRGFGAIPNSELPEWWPKANSARILFHLTTPVKRSMQWKPSRRFA